MGSEELALRMTGSAPELEDSRSAEESADVVKRAIAGDRTAFDELVVRYERRVFMTAWRLLGRAEDAQDAAQEVFVRFIRHMRRFDPNRPLLPWLYRMTVNVCRDLQSKRRRSQALAMEVVNPANQILEPAEESTKAEQRRIIAAALKTLTEKERASVVLRDIQGLSTKEVADILGSSQTTVRSQVSSARVKIRKFVDSLEKRQP